MKTSFLITKEEILKFYKPVNPLTHKGPQGHAVIIAGSYGKIGGDRFGFKILFKIGLWTRHDFYTKMWLPNPADQYSGSYGNYR